MKTLRLFFLAGLLLAAGFAPALAADKPPKAKISIHGLGLISDRTTRVSLARLWGDNLPPLLTTNQIEDAGLFIASNLADDGFHRPTISVEATLADGGTSRFKIDPKMETLPPRGLQASEVHFEIRKGVRSYFEKVGVTGIHVLKESEARAFFFTDAALIEGKGARAFSTARLRRSADALESTLRQRGYAEAVVRIEPPRENLETGAVEVSIRVDEGPRWELQRITLDCKGPQPAELAALTTRQGVPWSHFRGQDLGEEIRRMYFTDGYADVRVRIETQPQQVANGVRPVVVVAHILPGQQVAVGQVEFTGQKKTKESVLRRRVRIPTGAPLNPVELEKARYRLGRLGVFHSVDLRYEPATGPVRDPIFILEEEKPLELSVMAGYGSYERLRGGIELLQRNVFGRAHQSRLELVQSFKSSRADYTYSVPEIFGESIDGSARLFGLKRDERAFVREEYGGTLTLKRKVPWLGADGTLGYTYQSLRNADNELTTRVEDERQLTVASIDLGLGRDARDNPLRPRHGYRWFFRSELAAHELGSEVNYQRIEFGAAYHTSWGRGRWVHAGLTHGFVTTLGSNDRLLPVNRRFYPGGEDSIRGYAEGEAAPRGEDGRYVGAKSYLLLNLELEQALTKSWSVVVFTDGLGMAAKLASYPYDTTLATVGLGLRYHTLIGPVRLEYGHNVKRRDDDPSGAVHFSVGFPF